MIEEMEKSLGFLRLEAKQLEGSPVSKVPELLDTRPRGLTPEARFICQVGPGLEVAFGGITGATLSD